MRIPHAVISTSSNWQVTHLMLGRQVDVWGAQSGGLSLPLALGRVEGRPGPQTIGKDTESFLQRFCTRPQQLACCQEH